MNLRHETTSLIQAGIGGTIYKVISPGGWIAQAFGHSVKAGFSVLVGLAALLAFFYISRTWTPSQRHRHATANFVVAALALAGLVYLAHFFATGVL